jgi:hypothetical protein
VAEQNRQVRVDLISNQFNNLDRFLGGSHAKIRPIFGDVQNPVCKLLQNGSLQRRE